MKRLIPIFVIILIVITACNKEISSPVQPVVKTFGEFTIPQGSIKSNPSGYSPLSALVNFTTPENGKTKLIIKGKNGVNSDIEYQFEDFGINHSIPVAGLYADYENSVEFKIYDEHNNELGHSTIKIVTQPLPPDLPTSIIINIAHLDKMEKGLSLISNLSKIAPATPIMVDAYGDIRWVLDFSKNEELKKLLYGVGIEKLKNGNFYFGDMSSNKIFELDVLGNIINRWEFPGYSFHHNVQEKPNGNFLVTANKEGSKHTNGTVSTEDYIIEIDRKTGAIINEWDLKESLDEYRSALALDKIDWIHLNAVIYDPIDNTIIVSGRHQGVIKLTYSNKVKWIMSPHKGWGKNRKGEDLNQFLLTPLDANGNKITDSNVLNGNDNHPDFEWNWYQHSPSITPNGTILLFDNGDIRNYNHFTTNHYSRAVEYKIDEQQMTIKQIWSYGKERGEEAYSNIYSMVQYLPNTNNILFCPASQVHNSNGKGGKIIEVDYKTKEVVFEMSICTKLGWAFQRAKRSNIYH